MVVDLAAHFLHEPVRALQVIIRARQRFEPLDHFIAGRTLALLGVLLRERHDLPHRQAPAAYGVQEPELPVDPLRLATLELLHLSQGAPVQLLHLLLLAPVALLRREVVHQLKHVLLHYLLRLQQRAQLLLHGS